MKIKYKLLAIILSLLVIFAISGSINLETWGIDFSQSNSVIWVILLAFIYFIANKCFEIKDKRLHITSIIFSIILSTMYILGEIVNKYLDLSMILSTGKFLVFYIAKWLGIIFIIYLSIVLLFNFLNKKNEKENTSKEWKIFKPIKTNYFIYWAIICIAYIPYLLTYFPGTATPDSLSQILQGLGETDLSNHHPILHTAIIGIFMRIGGALGNYNIGIALYSITQMIIVSAIFAYAVYYMNKKNVPVILRVIALIYYAFYPVHSIYSITMWKDILFALCMLLFTIILTELIQNKEEFFKSKKKIILFTISMIFVILFRNNGLYAVLLTMPFVLVFARKYYKPLLISFFIVILFYSVLWKGIVFKAFNIQEGSIVEALSVPMQQIARVVNSKEEKLTDEEKEQIHKFWPIDNLGEIYDPRLSDNVKWSADVEQLKENKGEFIKLWLKLFVKYPITYVESFLCNSYGYWYPEASSWVIAKHIDSESVPDSQSLNLEQKPIIEGKLINKLSDLTEKRNVPVLSMVFSIGFAMWLVFIQMAYIIYKKKYKLLIIFVPILALWLTNLASPVYCEFRYMYSLFTCLPILLFAVNKNEEK